jgi:hypothetical protein
MATHEAGARLHRAMLAGRPSHMVPGMSPRPLDSRCYPSPGTLRCHRAYRRAGPAGRTDDRAHMAWMGAAGHRR